MNSRATDEDVSWRQPATVPPEGCMHPLGRKEPRPSGSGLPGGKPTRLRSRLLKCDGPDRGRLTVAPAFLRAALATALIATSAWLVTAAPPAAPRSPATAPSTPTHPASRPATPEPA